jgi:Chlorophyll A-B binding protein
VLYFTSLDTRIHRCIYFLFLLFTDAKIANWLGMAPLLDASDRAPSLLNGGLGTVSPIYWAVCLVAAGAIDVYGITKARKNEPGYFAGNLGMDPFGLFPKDKAGQDDMILKELKNGRLAMIAITAFAFQEFVTKFGVVDETPLFFKPIGTVLHDYANSGYFQP